MMYFQPIYHNRKICRKAQISMVRSMHCTYVLSERVPGLAHLRTIKTQLGGFKMCLHVVSNPCLLPIGHATNGTDPNPSLILGHVFPYPLVQGFIGISICLYHGCIIGYISTFFICL